MTWNTPSPSPTTPKIPFVHGLHRYSGSCQCRAVRFEVELDLSMGTGACNCRYCTKLGWWSASTTPASFTLLSDEAVLGPKPDGPFDRRHCPTCGVLPFGRGHLAELGGDFVSINVRCLDGVDLDGVLVRTLDGASDTWAPLGEHRFARVGGAR